MNNRIIHFLQTDSLSIAEEAILAKYDKLSDLTIIDTSKDFNQNKWLGQELTDTLIYITPKTRINGILSVCGCILGSCHLFFVFEKGQYSAFYQQFFIPKLKYICQSQQNIDKFIKTKNHLINTDNDKNRLNRLKNIVKTGQITHLIGERGTGKSTLLGIYIDNLCKNKASKVILLSPSRLSSQNTLKYLQEVSRETFYFFTPYTLDLSVLSTATDIIVDEAASIHRSILEKISQCHNSKIIFATTIDGYEGTGQSYRLAYLNQKSSHIIHLTEPKRFPPSDPLYQLSRQLCQPKNSPVNLTDKVRLLSSKTMQEKGLLLPTFALLQTAHYRTTPNDFARFYDDNAKFITVIKNKRVIGATYLLEEGLSETKNNLLITDIIRGKRRVKNAMTQQALINAYGNREIADSKILRISRIATDKGYRRQRTATEMINHLTDIAQQKQIDFISTSFSGKSETLQFWLSQGFILARIGVNPNKWHNQFALLMLKPLSVQGEKITKKYQQYFIQHYRYYRESYRYQDKKLSMIIEQATADNQLDNQVNNLPISTDKLIEAIDSVTVYHRDIHWILPIIHCWIKKQTLPNHIDNSIKTLLTGKFLDKKNKNNVVNTLLLLKNYLNS